MPASTSIEDASPLLADGESEPAAAAAASSKRGGGPVTALTPTVLLFIAIAAAANILFGFENSVISQAKIDFATEFNVDKSSAAYGFLSSAMPLGATAACLFAGLLQDGLGRRVTLILATLLYLGSVAISFFATGYAMLVAGRLVTGVSIGTLSSTVPMYIAELAPPHLRGTLVTLNQVCICTGVLFGYAMDKALTPHWRWELASGAPLAVAVLLAFIFVTPYSPRWLMARGRDDEARTVLLRLRGGRTREVAAEMALIADAIAQGGGAGRWAKLTERHVLWGVAIGVIAALMQQWCGVNAVNAYAQDIFEAAGFSASAAATQAIYIGVAKLLFVIVALYLMDRAGRKPLLLIGAAGMAATLIALALTFQVAPNPFPPGVGYLASASLVLYMAFFEISLGPVLWLLLSELYPLKVKGVAMSVGAFTCWLMTFAVTQLVPLMKSGLGYNGLFFFFAGVCVVSFFWIWVYLFETKGRSLEEIEDLLRGPAAVGGGAKVLLGADGAKLLAVDAEL